MRFGKQKLTIDQVINENSHDSAIVELCIHCLELQKEIGWISVDDKLPEKEGVYICAVQVGSVSVETIVRLCHITIKPTYSAFVCGDWQEATHWMPLPQPPKNKHR